MRLTKPRGYWTKDKVSEEIQKLKDKSDSYANKFHKDIYNAAIRCFGSWHEAVKESCEEYNLKCEKWTKERVLEEIKKFNTNDGMLIKKKDPKLYWATERHFGSWRKAVSEAGFVPQKIMFDEKSILEELKNIKDKSASNLHKNYSALYSRIINNFEKGLEEALEKIGINYNDIRILDKSKTDEEIIEEIKKLENTCYTHMIENNSKLYHVAKNRFGNWENALAKANKAIDKNNNKNISEDMVYNILSKNIKYKIIRWFRGNILKNKKTKMNLELDFYIPELKIAIEYQGKQHFHPVNFGGMSDEEANKEFNKQKRRDKIKKRLLKKNGIKLVEITYKDKISEENIKNILIKQGVINESKV